MREMIIAKSCDTWVQFFSFDTVIVCSVALYWIIAMSATDVWSRSLPGLFYVRLNIPGFSFAILGGTEVHWLALSLLSERFLGFNLVWGLSIWTFLVFKLSMWVF